MKEIVIISAWPNTEFKEKLLLNCIKQFKSLGKEVLLVSHYAVPEYIARYATYYIYDSYNILDTNHNLNSGICDFWMNSDSFRVEACFPSHSPSLCRIFGIALDFAKSLGYEYFTIIESDSKYDISDLMKLDSDIKQNMLNQHKKLFFFKLRSNQFTYWENQGIFEVYETSCFGGFIDEFQSKLKFPKTLEDWDNLRLKTKSIQNLEHVITNCFKEYKDNYLILDSFRHVFSNSKINLVTIGEPSGIYYNINNPKNPILFFTNAQYDKKTYKIQASQWGIPKEIELNSGQWYYLTIDCSKYNQDIQICLYENDELLSRNLYLVNDEFLNDIKKYKRIIFK